MKQLLLAIFALLTICSCGDIIERDGDWPSMKWEKTDYRVVKEGTVKYYYVPAEGGTYTFRCTNYHGFWLADMFFEVEGKQWHSYEEVRDEPDYEHYSNELIDVTAKRDGELIVVFQPNTGSVRKVSVGVTAGDIFDTFHFVQSAGR